MIERYHAMPVGFRACYGLVVGLLGTLILAAPVLAERLTLMVRFPVRDPWFPFPMQESWLIIAVVLIQYVVTIVALIRPHRGSLRAFAWTTLLFGATWLLHQVGFGWAGGVVLFWSGVWALWLTHAKSGLERGPLYCLLLLGGLFAWPALGKLSPGYIEGQIFYDLHWRHGAGIHGLVGGAVGDEEHRALASVVSPLAIVAEGLVALAWLFPWRIAAGVVLFVTVALLASGGAAFIRVMAMIWSLLLSGWILENSPEIAAIRAEAD